MEPPGADDLKLINGIGPAVVTRLNGVGILTFAQLAAMSPADLAAAVADLTGLTAERIIKQDWIGQARELAAQSTSPRPEKDAEPLKDSQNNLLLSVESQRDDEPATDLQDNDSIAVEPQKDAEIPAGSQNYARFMIEVFLDEENNRRSTHIVHVQSRDEDTWADWQGSRLLDFIAHRLGKNFTLDELTSTILPVSVVEPTPPVIDKRDLAGVLRLSDIEIVLGETTGRHGTLSNGQPFGTRLMLDLTDIALPEEEQLRYTAVIYGKRLESRVRLLIGEGRGTITPADRVAIDVDCTAPSQGTYHLEAALTLVQPATDTESADLSALTKGGLLHVH